MFSLRTRFFYVSVVIPRRSLKSNQLARKQTLATRSLVDSGCPLHELVSDQLTVSRWQRMSGYEQAS